MSASTKSNLAPELSRQPNELLVVRLRGTQAEMGAQHGRALMKAGGYEAAAEFYPGLPKRLLSDDGANDWVQKAVEAFGSRALDWAMRRIERNRPKIYRERTRAFIEAMDQDPELSRFLMIMDVFQNAVGVAGRLGLGPFTRASSKLARQACSTLMVWDTASAGGQLRHARNFDLPGIGVWDRSPEVVLCDPDEGLRYGYVTTRGADTPGITAFNEAGLTLTMHTRFHRDVRLDGLGVVDLGHEIVRRAETLEDAVRVAQERPICSSWGVAISSASERQAVVIETTGKVTAVVRPQRGDDFLAATNRNRHPQTMRGQVSTSPAWAEHSDGRELRMRMVAEAALSRGGLTAGELGRLMGDHEDATDPGTERPGGSVISQPITVKTIVAEPEERRIRVSAGTAPASWGPWFEVPWEWDGEVGRVAAGTPFEEPADEVLRCGASYRDGPRARAYLHFVEAHKIEMETHDQDAILAELLAAIRLDPDASTYRFLTGAILMRRGLWHGALQHFEHGLHHERAPFRRGQLLLWGARTAAAAGRAARAAAMRDELSTLQHPNLPELQALARVERRRGFPKRKLRGVRVNLELVDVL